MRRSPLAGDPGKRIASKPVPTAPSSPRSPDKIWGFTAGYGFPDFIRATNLPDNRRG
ncbi:hypothetical protein PSEUDO8O_120408 [Pseudomonas sp. 8O]|nr:hypothetical protein PSEUDO8O_120408 [Pseudomonas sp. 8O]